MFALEPCLLLYPTANISKAASLVSSVLSKASCRGSRIPAGYRGWVSRGRQAAAGSLEAQSFAGARKLLLGCLGEAERFGGVCARSQPWLGRQGLAKSSRAQLSEAILRSGVFVP